MDWAALVAAVTALGLHAVHRYRLRAELDALRRDIDALERGSDGGT